MEREESEEERRRERNGKWTMRERKRGRSEGASFERRGRDCDSLPPMAI